MVGLGGGNSLASSELLAADMKFSYLKDTKLQSFYEYLTARTKFAAGNSLDIASFLRLIKVVLSIVSIVRNSHKLPRLGKPTLSTAFKSVNQLTRSPPLSFTRPQGRLLPSSMSKISCRMPCFPSPVATKAILIP